MTEAYLRCKVHVDALFAIRKLARALDGTRIQSSLHIVAITYGQNRAGYHTQEPGTESVGPHRVVVDVADGCTDFRVDRVVFNHVFNMDLRFFVALFEGLLSSFKQVGIEVGVVDTVVRNLMANIVLNLTEGLLVVNLILGLRWMNIEGWNATDGILEVILIAVRTCHANR